MAAPVQDPLIELAIQSGMFPELGGGPAPTQTPAVVPGATAGYHGADTSEDDGHANPDAYHAAPEVAPAQNMPSMPPPSGVSGSQGYSRSGGYSQSGSGFSENKAKSVDKRDAGINRDLAGADAQARQMGQPVLDAENQARKASISAAEGTTKAMVNKITQEGVNAQVFRDLQDGFAKNEEEARIKSELASNAIKANYEAALNDFRASRVDPSQLWHGMSGGQKFGTLISVFVHDFLGAKGIHTSAMDTLNTAIDRNINAQVQAIKTKGEAAEGFKSLWYMQRNQSASDAEARARVKGFLLESAKQNVIANMAQYESALATSQGQAAIAEINKAYAKNLLEIHKHIDSNAASLRGQATQWNIAKLNAANESWANSIRAMEARTHRDALDWEKNKFKMPPPLNPSDILVDPEDNKGKWLVRQGTRPETVDKIKEVLINTAPANAAIQQLRDFERTLGATFDLTAGTRLSNEQQREYRAIQWRLAHSMVKANGERATKEDVEQFMESVPMETWFTRGGVERILANTQQFGLILPEQYIRQYADDIPEANWLPGPKRSPFAGAREDARAVATGDAYKEDHDTIMRKKALEGMYGPQSQEAVDAPAEYIRIYDKHFKETNPIAYQAMINSGDRPGQYLGDRVSQGEVSRSQLASMALQTEHKDGKEVPTDAAMRAYAALKKDAEGYLNSRDLGNDDDWGGAFSAMLLRDIESDYVNKKIYESPTKVRSAFQEPEGEVNMYGDFGPGPGKAGFGDNDKTPRSTGQPGFGKRK